MRVQIIQLCQIIFVEKKPAFCSFLGHFQSRYRLKEQLCKSVCPSVINLSKQLHISFLSLSNSLQSLSSLSLVSLYSLSSLSLVSSKGIATVSHFRLVRFQNGLKASRMFQNVRILDCYREFLIVLELDILVL